MRHPTIRFATFLCIALFVVLVSSACGGSSSTPSQTLTGYCSALSKSDYQTAYNQFESGIGITEAQYATLLKLYGNVTNCTPSGVNDSAGTGTVNATFANMGDVVFNETLVNDNGTWKIKNQKTQSTPSYVLNLYCLALKSADYKTAYSSLSSTLQGQVTQDQFVAGGTENNTRTVTDCTTSNVDNAAGTGTVTITSSNGLLTSQDYTLTQENGTWKINGITNTATETLNNYCSALKSQDYQSAFGDLSSALQNQVGSADKIASSYSSNKVTDCTVSNVNDSGGTGVISYTYADKTQGTFNYMLTNENNSWLISQEQQAQ